MKALCQKHIFPSNEKQYPVKLKFNIKRYWVQRKPLSHLINIIFFKQRFTSIWILLQHSLIYINWNKMYICSCCALFLYYSPLEIGMNHLSKFFRVASLTIMWLYNCSRAIEGRLLLLVFTTSLRKFLTSGGRLNKKDSLTRYGNSHVKDKTS